MENKQNVNDHGDVLKTRKKKNRKIGRFIKRFFRHISIEPANLMFSIGTTFQVSYFIILILKKNLND